jgi:biopolymer transport protein TolR
MVRRALARRAAEDAGTPGELNVVPFLDIVTNLLLFLLATVGAVLVVAELDAHLRGTRPGLSTAPPVTVSVTLVRSGIVVADATRHFTIPRRDGGYDFEALNVAMAEVHAAVDDDRAILSADPDVEYADVVRAMDAMRARGADALFPDLLISAGVR